MSSVVRPIRSFKALPKAKLAQKKVMVTVWWSASHLIHYSFLNPGKNIISKKYAQHIDEMQQKLQGLQPALVNRKSSVLLYDNAWHNQRFKSWTNWAMKFSLIWHIHLTSYQPTTISSSISTAFCNQQDAENAFQKFVESQGSDF